MRANFYVLKSSCSSENAELLLIVRFQTNDLDQIPPLLVLPLLNIECYNQHIPSASQMISNLSL